MLYYSQQHHRSRLSSKASGRSDTCTHSRFVVGDPLPTSSVCDREGKLFAQADAIEAAMNVVRQRAEKVDQAILARAFRGEL